jgi:hypothetical protein
VAELRDKMLGVAAAENPLLKAIYREPSITAYNRIEARPRVQDFHRSLRAEVRDALWLLTRQWQMGEFQAEDAGSAIDARLMTRRLQIDRVALGSSPAQPYDDTIPLETLVERERVPFTQALRVQIGQYFLKLHPAALRAKYQPRYLAGFGFEPNLEAGLRGQPDGLNLYAATVRRAIDGKKLLAAATDASFATTVTIDAADAAAIDAHVQSLMRWFERQYSQPAGEHNEAWDDSALSYRFAAAAPAGGDAQLAVSASHYCDGRVDWFSFDVDKRLPTLTLDIPDYVAPAPVDDALSFLPTAAVFKGMPSPRFWEMEDRKIDFGKLNARTTDQLLLVFAEMGLIYGNDWFVIPYRMPVNSFCETLGLVVTNVFGERTLIAAADAGAENDWQRWSLFNLSDRDLIGQYTRQFLLPAALTQNLEGESLERVELVRDEMANMVWAVEVTIPDETGRGIDGHAAADKTGVKPPPIAVSTAAIRYLLGTTVPENWIPFLPVQRAGSHQDIAFQRAAMPKLDVPPREVIRPKGVVLNEPKLPWYVNEEEVSFAGTLVRRGFQRARWYDGRTYLWIGRRRETGHGAGISGLRFDQIEPTPTAPGPPPG